MQIRVTYNNGQRALLAIEKGVPGDRVVEEVLTAWGQNAADAATGSALKALSANREPVRR